MKKLQRCEGLQKHSRLHVVSLSRQKSYLMSFERIGTLQRWTARNLNNYNLEKDGSILCIIEKYTRHRRWLNTLQSLFSGIVFPEYDEMKPPPDDSSLSLLQLKTLPAKHWSDCGLLRARVTVRWSESRASVDCGSGQLYRVTTWTDRDSKTPRLSTQTFALGSNRTETECYESRVGVKLGWSEADIQLETQKL